MVDHLAWKVALSYQVVRFVPQAERDVMLLGPKRVGHDLDDVIDALDKSLDSQDGEGRRDPYPNSGPHSPPLGRSSRVSSGL